MEWQPIETAPKDRPIVAWCVHKADPYHLGNGRLTLYGAHVEGLSHAQDGLNIVIWGGGWADGYEDGGGQLPDWWFVNGSEFEIAANPTKWIDVKSPTSKDAA